MEDIKEITISVPDDFHHHLRDGEVLADLVPLVATKFHRIVVMPNLNPPICTVQDALLYRERILQHSRAVNPTFTPLMTLYLTDHTTVEDIRQGKASEFIIGAKLYPSGATTNSQFGVTDIEKIFPVLQTMEEVQLPLLIHGEVTSGDIDIFDREEVFIRTVLNPLLQRLPRLKVVLEHITTSHAVDFLLSNTSANIAATITPHHLLYNRNALFHHGVCPHMYCLPILKREQHRQALLQAIASGNKRFFIGTDSAPHAQEKKESSCGCAGIFNAHIAIELYIEAFASVNALHHLEAFLCRNGPEFYGLSCNGDDPTLAKLVYVQGSQEVPESFKFGSDSVLVPLRAGSEVSWRLKSSNYSK